MTASRYHTSRPDQWTHPRGRSGLSREYVHGRLQPMPEPKQGFWAKVFGRGW